MSVWSATGSRLIEEVDVRKLMALLVLLVALLVCTLTPGTPVNNDPSPAAEVAGIHLTTAVSHSRGTLAVVAAAVGMIVTITLACTAGGVELHERRSKAGWGTPRSLLRAWSGDTRGPPLRAS